MKRQSVMLTTLGALVLAFGVLTACGTGGSGYVTTPNSQATNANGYSAAASSQNPPSGTTSTSGLSVDTTNKAATLTLVASENGDNHGFNFNGFSNGAMTVTVPIGWTVHVVFQNDSTDMMHSAMIVPFDERSMGSGFTAAFPNASTPNAEQGTMNGVTQTFTFTADKTGTYAIICAVPGHSTSGFWDTLNVSTSATEPTIQTSAASTTNYGGSGW